MIIFKHLFRFILSWPSGCGKTVICHRLLKNLNDLCTVPNFAEVICCYSENSAVPKRKLAKQGNKIRFHHDVPEFSNEWGRPRVLILDVLISEVNSKDMCDLFTKGNHHRNISVILITQNMFQQGKYSRDISLNTKNLVI